MRITDAFVLPGDVLLQPIGELSSELRSMIDAGDGDYALSRSNSRAHTKVLSPETAELVGLFREPTTIARAVARFSLGKPTKPEQLLQDALPLLRTLIADGLLTVAGSWESQQIVPSLSIGTDILGWTVFGCVQTTEDVEVYQVRDPSGAFAALKLGRRNADGVAAAMEREARITGLVDTIGAHLMHHGLWDGRPYLLLEWLHAASAQRVFAEFRRRSDWKSRAALRDLGSALLASYSLLHDRGIIHGDIHPRNVAVDRQWRVKLLDFGLARLEAESGNPVPRGGVAFFFEPEFAATMQGDGCELTPAGEQYSLAAMLYLLVTGAHYLDFKLERDAMLLQIAHDPVVSFEQRGVASWPAAERVLGRALSKRPEDRFASVHEFAAAWRSASVPRAPHNRAHRKTHLRMFQSDVLNAAAIGGAFMREESAPTCSLNHGSAGVAYALYRIARASDSGEILALADAWSERTIRRCNEPGAFENKDIEITADAFDAASPYHGLGGGYLVRASVASARGDVITACESAQQFVDICKDSFEHVDVTFGRSGALLGLSFTLDMLPKTQPAAKSVCGLARQVGDDLLRELWETTERCAPVGEASEVDHLGVAHGWAGLLYATCCWCSAAGTPLPREFDARARQLADCAEPVDRGLRWRWESAFEGGNTYMPGWCNGSAGYVFLWDEAFRLTRNASYLQLAEGAAWNTWEGGASDPSLCCGAAGQAYALLRWHRRSGEAVWLRRARDLADFAVINASGRREHENDNARYWHRGSLYRGNSGLAVLVAELSQPAYARMPMFERCDDAEW